MFQEKWTDDYFLLKLKIKHYVRYVEKWYQFLKTIIWKDITFNCIQNFHIILINVNIFLFIFF